MALEADILYNIAFPRLLGKIQIMLYIYMLVEVTVYDREKKRRGKTQRTEKEKKRNELPGTRFSA